MPSHSAFSLGPSALRGARWIGPDEATVPPAGDRPAYEIARYFSLRDTVGARLVATAHGVYEAYLNGVRVGDHELAPGFTSYRSRLYVQEHDVTALVRNGANELKFVLSDGWWRGRCGAARVPDGFGTEVAVIGRLVAVTATGESVEISTDDSWQFRIGEIVAADLMDGQTTDFRRANRDDWAPVVISAEAESWGHVLEVSPAPPVRATAEVTPVSVTRLASGRQVVDFGVNLNGWVRLTQLGPRGRKTQLSHGEALTGDGDLTTDHLRFTELTTGQKLPAGQVDTVISRGFASDVFEPRHTVHGFRYVAVDGCVEELEPTAITAVLVRSDLRRTGTFTSNNDDLNRLHEVVRRSWETNSCDIPTDCPQRERFGYTGDFQIFVDAAAYLDDVEGFGRKWLRSLADDQDPSGRVPNVAPDCGALPGVPAGMLDGSAGWGDASTFVPWALYQAYGDKEVLRQFLPLMRRWVDWAAGKAAAGRHITRSRARPERADHDTYLWDTGFHWGEWLEPDVTDYNPGADFGIIATAYLARSSELVALTAAELGDTETEAQYRQLHRRVRDAWQREFLLSDGLLSVDRQAHYVRALAFGLVDEQQRSALANRLVELILDVDTHLTTGFLSTGLLLPTLAEAGRTDVALELLMQRTAPSWLTMLDRGATTVWEEWNGLDEHGDAHGSLNHYSKGAVITFLHRHIAGIAPLAPGYRRFSVVAQPNAHVQSAEGTLATRYGDIRSAWHVEDGNVHVEVTVPAGTVAEVHLPGRSPLEAAAGEHHFVAPFPAHA